MSSPTSELATFLNTHHPSAVPEATTEAELPNLSPKIFPDTSYTDTEKVEIHQWLTTSSRLAVKDEDEAKHAERLGSLNTHLSTRTTLLGSKPSIADLALYHRLAPAIRSWSSEERTGEKGYHHIVRHTDFVQNAPLMGLSLPEHEKVKIDVDDVKSVLKPIDPKAEKERLKKEKASAAASANGAQKPLVVGQGKEQTKDGSTVNETAAAASSLSSKAVDGSTQGTRKEKKEKAPKQPKAPAKPESTPLSPHLIDLRVGDILRAKNHPDADSLFVSTIACGDTPGADNTSLDEETGKTVRTVCSGLNGLVPLAEMQGRKVVAVCNLKPVKMRGIVSAAMVLAASPRLAEGEEDHHKGPVELVEIPEGTEAGERLCFSGWEGEPEGVLNPKKKTWETLQPGFTTDAEGRVGFDQGAVEALNGDERGKNGLGFLKTKGGEPCKVKSLKGAIVR